MRLDRRGSHALLTLGTLVLALGAGASCSVDSARSQYLLAEKLWSDKKYAAAVNEFEKVASRDPRGKLGLQALYRAAMTQNLYLNNPSDALKKLRTYVQLSGDEKSRWEAQKQIGDILYERLERHEEAIDHYHELLQARASSPEAPDFLFRIGKSHYFLWQFKEAIESFRQLQEKYPSSRWSEHAGLEIGNVLFTRAERGSEDGIATPSGDGYKEAISAFKAFIDRYPNSPLVPEAHFGIASCLEESNQLDAAYQLFNSIRTTYPSPNVVEIKLARIRERKAQTQRKPSK